MENKGDGCAVHSLAERCVQLEAALREARDVFDNLQYIVDRETRLMHIGNAMKSINAVLGEKAGA